MFGFLFKWRRSLPSLLDKPEHKANIYRPNGVAERGGRREGGGGGRGERGGGEGGGEGGKKEKEKKGGWD